MITLKKKTNSLYLIKLFQLLLIIFFLYIFNTYYFSLSLNQDRNIYDYLYQQKRFNNELDYNHNFVIIRRKCIYCGLFSDYIVYLGCINDFINKGFVPIVDVKSYRNFYNGFKVNSSNINVWELFFEQPFGYKLNNVLLRAKKIKYFECTPKINRPNEAIFFNKILVDYWHNIQEHYSSINIEILKEANMIRRHLFKGSNNVLGLLIRGTDYIARKPRNHPIPPTPTMFIKDLDKIKNNYKYDWFFLSTEDDKIREIFIKQYGYKLKYLIYKKLKYDYNKKQFLIFNANIKNNIQYIKIYILNIIVLSKCIDIMTAQTSGSIGVFILSDGFRFNKVYNLGKY